MPCFPVVLTSFSNESKPCVIESCTKYNEDCGEAINRVDVSAIANAGSVFNTALEAEDQTSSPEIQLAKGTPKDESLDLYPVPLWKKDSWTDKVSEKNIEHINKCLRRPAPSATIELLRNYREGRKLPRLLLEAIENLDCQECAQNAQLPRVSR